jgi:regulator of cell morphogenesis and NO signaling
MSTQQHADRSMMSFANEPVGQLVRERIEWARVFEKLGIDYCCNGTTPLKAACKEKGVSIDVVYCELEESLKNVESVDEPDWSTAPLSGLADHIVERHHAYLREELPLLERRIERVVDAHAGSHQELLELQQVFGALKDELSVHMLKEEQVLFPIVRQLEKAKAEQLFIPQFHCGSVNNPIVVLEQEHDNAGEALRRMRELTNRYEPPADACSTYRSLLSGLHQLEADLHLHIHKENNILFPRAAELEASLNSGAQQGAE